MFLFFTKRIGFDHPYFETSPFVKPPGDRIPFQKQESAQKNGRHTIVCNEPALAYCDSCISLSAAKSLEDHQVTRGEKMLEVVAVSNVHHVGCTPCGVKKVILKPCSYPTI